MSRRAPITWSGKETKRDPKACKISGSAGMEPPGDEPNPSLWMT
jgi:hypothetical protein